MKKLHEMTTAELINYQTSYKPTAREWKMCEEELIRRRIPAEKQKAWHETALGKIAISVIAGCLLLAIGYIIGRHGPS